MYLQIQSIVKGRVVTLQHCKNTDFLTVKIDMLFFLYFHSRFSYKGLNNNGRRVVTFQHCKNTNFITMLCFFSYFLSRNTRLFYKDLDNNGLSDVSLERHIVIEIRVSKTSPHYHSCTDYIL